MKQFLILGLFLITSLFVYSTGPIILFSDIESGPKDGWSAAEPHKGAAVTIWGHGFGNSRGASYVTVNGTILNTPTDYAIWGEYWPTQYFQRITFYLNDTMNSGIGDIIVTVNGATSNPIPFTIRSGAIHFITQTNPGGNGTENNPFEISNSSSNWIDNMIPGDIYYFRDSLVYEGESNGGNSIIWIRSSETSGTASNPIALLAYPNERPVFSVPTYHVNHNKAVQFSNNYMVFSGFSIDSEWMGASMAGGFHRFIGNDVVGLKNWHGSGTGIVTTGDINSHTGDGNILLGNAIHGGNSQSRYDHGVYFSGCADDGGTELGWNHFYDNDFGRGPIISINHQQNRCTTGQVLDAHFVFNNIVDCSAQRATAINVYDLSYDSGDSAPEPTFVYNNVFINSGTFDSTDLNHVGYAPAMVHNAVGRARFYNNTLYNAGYIGFSIGNNVTNSYLMNNIIHMSSNFPGPTGNHYSSIKNESVVSLANNLYYGIGNYSVCPNCPIDQNNISNQDPLFVAPSILDLQLQANSPAIGAGTSNLIFEISPPAYAPIGRDLNFALRNIIPSIGAFESTTTVHQEPEANNLPDIVIYPNPSKNHFKVEFEATSTFDIGFEVFNVVGERILATLPNSYPTGKNQVQINSQGLESGMYILQMVENGNRTISRKFFVE